MERVRLALLELPYPAKRFAAVTLDVTLSILSVPVALYLRLGEVPILNFPLLIAVLAAALLMPALLAVLGTYRVVFRYAGWSGLMLIGRATTVYGVLFAGLFTLIGVPGIPRTIGVLQPLIAFLFIGGARGFVSMWLGGEHVARAALNCQRILIYGAGQAGRQLCAGLVRSRQHEVVGFVDDAPSLIGRTLLGKPIFDPKRLDEVHSRFSVTDLLLALPSASRSRKAAIIESVRRLPIHVRILPGIAELALGKISVADLRELEIDDLLGREIVPPDTALMARNVQNKVVLVTGAGGSIGSELCRQVMNVGPRVLILVDNSEFSLYKVHQELTQERRNPLPAGVEVVPLLASVCDQQRMSEVLRQWSPDTIYHAAAYKHVPLIEDNPLEGIRNNVFGTLLTAQLAEQHNVGTFILISTDKAVRPTNVMGATKRLAEQALQALAVNSNMLCAMVRFGNVLGSSGSVVPLFKRQIARGGPVTLTHPDIIRYFMTIPEAAQLVIQAGALASGGDLFVLNMGSPVRIYELAVNMIQLSGLSVRSPEAPDGDIEIRITGLRPGEKLYEELLIGDDPAPTAHPRIMTSREPFMPWAQISIKLEKLRDAIDHCDERKALRILRDLVPEYRPSGRFARSEGAQIVPTSHRLN